jgi:hypothetical protein
MRCLLSQQFGGNKICFVKDQKSKTKGFLQLFKTAHVQTDMLVS